MKSFTALVLLGLSASAMAINGTAVGTAASTGSATGVSNGTYTATASATAVPTAGASSIDPRALVGAAAAVAAVAFAL